MNNQNIISKAIWFHRKKSGLTQKQLAEIAGVGKSVIFDIENGKETVQLDTLLKILGALNISFRLDSPIIHLMENENEES
ncbi:MAG: helix-turn-helix domain-containing protein [Bacteroidota bacterium]